MANNNFISNRDNIRRIMAMDMNGTMDKMVKESVKNGTFTFGENGGEYTPKKTFGAMPRMTTVNPNSKLPKAIMESMTENPIDIPLPSGFGGSVLDGLDIPPLKKNQPITEQHIVPTQTIPQTSGIDYSLIKTIIDESVDKTVKKYISALSKKFINEGVGSVSGSKANMVVLGDTFSFCDKDGNVYEATLRFKKNIKKKLNE